MSRESNVLGLLNSQKNDDIHTSKFVFTDVEFVSYDARVTYQDGNQNLVKIIPVGSYNDEEVVQQILKCF